MVGRGGAVETEPKVPRALVPRAPGGWVVSRDFGSRASVGTRSGAGQFVPDGPHQRDRPEQGSRKE